MFTEFRDYGLIFVLLAIFGFAILDIFKTGRYWGIPDFYKSNVEKFFHYISTAVLFLCFALVIIVMALSSPNPENAITKFFKSIFSVFDNFHEFGILSDDGYTTIVKIFAYSSLFAFLYILIYGFVFLGGLYIRFGSAVQLNVFLREREDPIKFADIITVSNDFFFFLKEDGVNLWVAVRKDDILRIETIKGSSRIEHWIDLKKIVYDLKNKIKSQKSHKEKA